MSAREQARFDMVKRVGTFGTNNESDFNTPLAPAKEVSAGQTQATFPSARCVKGIGPVAP